MQLPEAGKTYISQDDHSILTVLSVEPIEGTDDHYIEAAPAGRADDLDAITEDFLPDEWAARRFIPYKSA